MRKWNQMEIEAKQLRAIFTSRAGTEKIYTDKEKKEVLGKFKITSIKQGWRKPLPKVIRKKIIDFQLEKNVVTDEIEENVWKCGGVYLMNGQKHRMDYEYSLNPSMKEIVRLNGKEVTVEEAVTQLAWLNQNDFTDEEMEIFCLMTCTRDRKRVVFDMIFFEQMKKKTGDELFSILNPKFLEMRTNDFWGTSLIYETEMEGAKQKIMLTTYKKKGQHNIYCLDNNGYMGGPFIEYSERKIREQGINTLMPDSNRRELMSFGEEALNICLLEHAMGDTQEVALKMVFDGGLRSEIEKWKNSIYLSLIWKV